MKTHPRSTAARQTPRSLALRQRSTLARAGPFIGSCQLNGHDLPGTAIGVLKNEHGVQILPAVSAWKIDEKQMKFIELKTEGIRCLRDGIITAAGGF